MLLKSHMYTIDFLCTIQPMQEKFYTSTDAAQITGCTPRQLQYWRQKGVVVPTVNTIGTGRNVYYSVADLLQLTVMQYFLSIGLSFEVCQATLDKLKQQEPQFFLDPYGQTTMRRFMLWQQSSGKQLDFDEFDEKKAIAAIRSGWAVVPLWTDLVKAQLENQLENFK
jgi:DNA-binding transcriptional MerR regulator